MYKLVITLIIVTVIFFCNFIAIKNAKYGEEKSALIWKALGDGIFLVYVCTRLISEK